MARLTPKPTVLEILDAGLGREPLEVIFARVGAAYPKLTGDEMQAAIQTYRAWLKNRIEKQEALARELELEMERREAVCS